ncbi:MAG: choice-of-anchor D domain-containing protein, partial [Solirubrobacteraceae bacterium]
MTTAREGAAAAPLPDGDVLIAGGFNGNSYLSSAEEFDPATGTFTALSGSMTTERYAAAAAPLPDGDVLIAGGRNNDGSTVTSAEVFEPAPEATLAGGGFGDQTVAQPSIVQTLTVTNIGSQTLSISGASLGGADPSDFAINSDSCAGRRLAFEQICTIQAQFTPSTTGVRSATLTLQDNEPTPASITLSGTGVAANSGPAGATG